MNRRSIVLVSLVAAAQSLAFSLGTTGLGDTDPYRHLQYARQLWLSGLTLRGHPFLPFTNLGVEGVDLWWGFHLLLIPFTAFGLLWGARLAGAAIAAFSAGGMTWVASRLGQTRPAWFVLIPYVTSSYFAYRAHVARPAYLTPPLIFVCLAAATGHVRARWAALAAFVHGWVHLSAPLSPLFAMIGGLGAVIADRSAWRRALGAVVGSLLGLGASVLLRPDHAHFLGVAWSMTHIAFGAIRGGHLPHSGGEGEAPPISYWLVRALGGWIALGAALWLGRGRTRSAALGPRLAALLAAVLASAMAFQVSKLIDYQLPALALAAALWWPADLDPAELVFTRLGGLVTAGIALLTVQAIGDGWAADARMFPPMAQLERLASQVRAQVPPGSMIDVDDWAVPSILYGLLPEYRYPVAYDPATLYGESTERYWTWEHAASQGVFCDQASISDCPEAHAGPEDVARSMRSLGAEWLATRGYKDPHGLLPIVQAAPDWFQPIGHADSNGESFTVWHLVRR